MTWVRCQPKRHVCKPPMGSFDAAGQLGDLWRCDDCGELWRVGLSCGACDRGAVPPHPGQHMTGRSWWPATFWQRIKNRRQR
jgi:hypothetical protein